MVLKEVKLSEKVLKSAQEIQDKCMGLEDAFCVSSCPMSTDAKGYVNLIGEDKIVEAMDLIREKLFLPGTLGRICAHPCEKECRRNTDFNQPIAIAALKRYAADNADDESRWNLSVKPNTDKKVAIIGAGPAGAQAAIDLRREGHSVEIFEKIDVFGGMMRVGIPEYRLPRNIIDFEYSYLAKLGIVTRFGIEIGKDIKFNELLEKFDAVIIANGAHKSNIINLENNDAKRVFGAVEYLKEISLTQSFDRAGENVVVIGGGDVAMDCLRSSFRIGAKTVQQCSLESMDNLPASHEEIEESLEEGVQFNAGWGPIKINVDESGNITGLVVKQVISVFDENGNFNPQYNESSEKVLACDTVIFATGQLVEDVTDGIIAQGRGGRYEVNKDTLATSHEKVFVAGDAAGTNIVVQAMAYGRKAAISINRYLNAESITADRDFEKEYSYTTKLDVPLPEGTVDNARIHMNLRPAQDRIKDFGEVALGFSKEEALEESNRCLKCECKLCMSECEMMNDFGSCPKDIFDTIVTTGQFDYNIAYSCNACDNCTIVCPHELPMKTICIASRNDFVNANNGNSPLEGHKAINMHQLLGFSKFFTMKKKGGK